jgi:hypothetical protein
MGARGAAVTPTLSGRWQTRIFLAVVLGVPITALYMLAYGSFDLPPEDPATWKLPLLLATVTSLGLAWDVLYIFLQSLRWDRDWPLAFQWLSGAVEGGVVLALFQADVIPGVTYADGDWWRFGLHYTTIWWTSWVALFGPLRVFFPRWRFRGGEFV